MPSQSEIQQQITDRILAGLRSGVIPWRKPWSTDPNSGSPANAISRRPYSGINPILLDLVSMSRGYTSRFWATYQQWATLGCQVRRRPADIEPGTWGTSIVLYKSVEKTVEEDGEQKKHRFPLLRYFTVFHCEQVDGLIAEKLRVSPQAIPSPLSIDYEPAQDVVDATKADIRYGGDLARYLRPYGLCPWPHHMGGDYIEMPLRERFSTPHEFYATAYHELTHWSEVRLGWEGTYAYGELIAEIAGCFVCAEVGIPNSDDLSNHTAYLSHWLRDLENDPKAILRAASQASKAAKFILGFSQKAEELPVEEAEHATG